MSAFYNFGMPNRFISVTDRNELTRRDREMSESGSAEQFRAARSASSPFPHWILDNLLPTDLLESLRTRPSEPTRRAYDGNRDGVGASIFFNKELAQHDEIAAETIRLLSSNVIVSALQSLTSTALAGTWLRVALCTDHDGFFLKPHKDMPVKLLTLIIYLSEACEAQRLGTDLYFADGTWALRAPSRINSGLLFRPDERSIHGFEPSPFQGERRTLVVNFVTSEWKSSNQLAGMIL